MMDRRRTTARELIATVLDEGSIQSWDDPIDVSDYPLQYQQELEKARERSGCDESVLTGRGTAQGRPVAFIVSEFRFLAGSIGRDAARRIVNAIRRATAVTATASGGATTGSTATTTTAGLGGLGAAAPVVMVIAAVGIIAGLSGGSSNGTN